MGCYAASANDWERETTQISILNGLDEFGQATAADFGGVGRGFRWHIVFQYGLVTPGMATG